MGNAAFAQIQLSFFQHLTNLDIPLEICNILKEATLNGCCFRFCCAEVGTRTQYKEINEAGF